MAARETKYQIIPRKYRPQNFSSVLCQEAIVKTLKNALRLGMLAQAYLFCGARGTGKTTLARVLAKAMNCSNLTQDGEPCSQCSSCTQITLGKSLDVLEIDGASNRGIDDIRQLNETIGYAPAEGRYKIYLIDEVHMLTKEAFNALLKTLEEPPAHVKFFFATTEPHKVLPTIVSRCQRFDLGRITLEGIQKKLSWIAADLGLSCEEEALRLIAEAAEGSLRDAESLLDQVICYTQGPVYRNNLKNREFGKEAPQNSRLEQATIAYRQGASEGENFEGKPTLPKTDSSGCFGITQESVASTLGLLPKEFFFRLDEAVSKAELLFAFELAEQLFTFGKDLGHFLDHLMDHYRTLLLCKFHGSLPHVSASLQERYKASSSLYTEEQCLYILDSLTSALQQQTKTSFKRIHLEMLLLNLLRSSTRIGLGTLVRRLTELEKNALNHTPPAEKISNQTCPANSPPQETVLAGITAEKIPKETYPERQEKVLARVTAEEKSPEQGAGMKKHRDETLLRFAAVELEGVVKT